MTAELDSNLEPATQVKASDQREGRDGPRALPSQRVNIYLKKKSKQNEKTSPENQDIRIKVSTHNNNVA